MQPTREVFWNISYGWVMYVLLVPTMLIAGYGVFSRVRRWKIGQPAARFDRPLMRLQRVVEKAILQRPIWRRSLSGLFHSLLFWGFVTLAIATTVVFVHHDFNLPIMQGNFYLYFQSLFVDVMGFLSMLGVGIAMIQRCCVRPGRLVFTKEANWILASIFAILATGFLVEGWRIAVTEDTWGAWSPVGYVVAQTSAFFASADSLRQAHLVFWWLHLGLVFAFIAWAPYTKMIHVVTSTLNIYTSDLDSPCGKLKPIDFDTAESFGVNSLEQLSWKDLLDLDACTECGRCTSVCPANSVGKQLSPRDIILDLRTELTRYDEKPNRDGSPGEEDTASAETVRPGLIGAQPALSTEALFQCTTCAACVEACPVAIEQYPKIVDLRRFQVMEEAEYPRQMQDAIASLEQRGHPFRGSQASRTDWADGLDLPLYADLDDPEVLLWVGCGGALVDRNQQSTRAIAQLLLHAGVRFGILGKEESCSGDPARRIGNEFLFDTLVRKNIETLTKQKVHTIVTPCPHCFNSFKNEYPDFGSSFEVVHHTTFLARLVGDGRLKLNGNSDQTITLHDPCYLSRHNSITEEPRRLLDELNTTGITEMPRNKAQSFCCGGGGGMSFVDEPAGQRVNQERAREAVTTGADTVAVACPFCTTMLEDGLAAVKGDRQVEVKDIAQLMLEQVAQEEQLA